MGFHSKLLLLQCFVTLLSLAHARSGFFSAMCVIFQQRCPLGMQTESEGCKAVTVVQQTRQCLEAVCTYCGGLGNQFPCLRSEIKQACDGSQVRSTLVLSAPPEAPMEPVTPNPTPAPSSFMASPTPVPVEPMMAPVTPIPVEPMMATPTPTMIMDIAPSPTMPPLPMNEPDMGMPTSSDNGAANMGTNLSSSEEPMESPDMSIESSPMPGEMTLFEPLVTPMYTPMYTPKSDGEPMMMDETTMPPMTMDETTMPPTMSEMTTMPPSTMPPTTTTSTTEAPPTQSMATISPMTNSKPSECVYSGTDIVTIPLGSVTPADGWVKKSRAGMNGLVFRPDKNHGILKPGVEGVMCFSVRLSLPGDYHLTAVSAAPDRTENNDMWIKSSKPLTLIRKGMVINGNTDWYKGYQNEGNYKIADHLKTVDNRGHDFVITNVRANEMFNICVSGRSYRYEVFKIIVNKCTSARCLQGPSPRGSLINSAPSLCS